MYKVDKNIPLPKRSRFGFITEMAQGDSFVVAEESEKVGAVNYARRYGIKITTRKVDEGFRIWRM